MGGGGKQPAAFKSERYIGIQVQTSAYGGSLPIVFGTNRIPGNLIWYGDFKAIALPQQQQGGKGGGGAVNVQQQYRYEAAVMLALCEGPIAGINRRWKDKDVKLLSATQWTLIVGARTQSPWSYLTTNHPSEAVGYAGTALVAIPNSDLSDSATMFNFSFEVQGLNIVGGGNLDAHPVDIVTALLTDDFYGAGWPSGRVGDLTTGASSYRTYCTAAGFFLSPVISEQKPTRDHIREILDATNSEAVWSQGVLKIIPYGDVAVTGNSTTFTPNTTPVFDLGVDDFLVGSPDEDPITVERTSQADTFNSCPVEYKDRSLDYNASVVEDPDPVDVEAFGLRKDAVTTLHCITLASVALQVSRIRAQRQIYQRNKYRFKLSAWKYALLDPMDLVTITEPTFGLDHKVVRVLEIQETDDGDLQVTAGEWPFGVATATSYTPQPGPSVGINTDISPGNANAPVIFEAPEILTDGSPSLMLATSGGTNWGGAQVWVSFDGSTYSLVGKIMTPARHGVLTATLATNATTNDTTHTLSVDLAVSGGTLVSASAADKDDLVTLCWVDGELMAFQTAALVTGNTYNLTTLRRGAYGTPISAHSSATKFARIDAGIFQIPIPSSRLGSILYVKLQSFNKYGDGLQDLASVTAYSFTPAVAKVIPPYPSAVTLTRSTTAAPAVVAGQRRHKFFDEGFSFGFDVGGAPVVKRNAWATIAWTFTNPYPTALLSGFRVALFTGTDPNDESAYVVPTTDVGPDVTSLVLTLLTPKVSATINAAVQALYLGGTVESSWRLSTGSVNADPDTLPVGTTSNYTQDGSGNPTAGAQLIPGTTTPLKLGPGGCQIGLFTLDEPILRSLNSIRRDVSSERAWYAGNDDNTVNGGVPNIARLVVKRMQWDTTLKAGRLSLRLQPQAATDNLDGMRYAQISWFRQSAAGTTGTLTLIAQTFVPIPDRTYYNPGTDTDSNNAVEVTSEIVNTNLSSGFPACIVTLVNAFGPSDANCFYAGVGNTDASNLVNNGGAWPAGLTGGGSIPTGGAPGVGGTCVTPETPIMLASGRHVAAGSLRVGDLVWTLPDGGNEWGAYPVTSVQQHEADVCRVAMTDGRALLVSLDHRLLSRAKWKPAQNLQHGDVIDGLMPGVVDVAEPAGRSAVLRITVDRAHTYLTDRLLSHNAKRLS